MLRAFGHQKNSILAPTIIRSLFAVANSCASCRDKIEFQFAVPKVREPPRKASGPASGGIAKIVRCGVPSTGKSDFLGKCFGMRQREQFWGCWPSDGDRREHPIGTVDLLAPNRDRLVTCWRDDLAIAPISTSSSLGGMNRLDERNANQLRPVNFELGIAPHASGSVLVSMGSTRVLCGVMIEESRPALDEGSAGHRRVADRRIFDAAVFDIDPQAAGHLERPARRPEQRDPTADRPLDARGGRSGEIGSAHDLGRLRCAASRRRDPDGRDYRSQPGCLGGLPATGERRKNQRVADQETRRGGQCRCD